ncbi:hypothetical protein ORV05_29745 [Amycolatopsis cynarae]|uniref:Integral membrane protein n=1 Tax=Amycolatopsis cynarae TaxID=2995223 RepID=A0ABY7AZE0_9PSEU|nr:hypothetical protein [Amycolatopsis sp. HUAS 11-8]WAL65060.1 hypothetical protein ORV05_29745 [Amycolatopsis sp. HUAS 11-8]
MTRTDLPTESRRPDALEGPNATLHTAIALGATAAVLGALGSALPVVSGGAAGYSSAPLLIVLALAPMALVAVFVLRARISAAAGVLAGAAALAPGRAVADLQFLADPSVATRPELYRTQVFELPAPAAGLWLLLAGHVFAVAAGVAAVSALGARAEPGNVGRGRLLAGTLFAGIAAVGVLMAPLSTDDAFLPVGSAFEAPALVLAGCLLLAFALPVAAWLSLSSGTGELGRGGLLGVTAAAVAVSLPNLVSGLVLTGVAVAAGPIVVLAGALGLAVVAFLPVTEVRPPSGDDEAAEASLPGKTRLQKVTGALAAITLVTAVAGTLTPQVVMVHGLPGPQSPWRWLLLAAGLPTGVLGAAMFPPRVAALVRPALSVAWAGVPLAATAVLTTAITATELGGAFSPGTGVLWTATAAVAAGATGCCSVVAGMVERDELDETAGAAVPPGPDLVTPLVAGAILAVGAFGTPVIVAPDYVEPALSTNFGTPSWGLLLGLALVLGAATLAPRCRPARAAALLAGAACLAGLRVAELPLAGSEIAGAHAGLGWWLALGCVLALVLAAVMAARGAFHNSKRPTGSIR